MATDGGEIVKLIEYGHPKLAFVGYCFRHLCRTIAWITPAALYLLAPILHLK